ncbi:transposase [Lacrimispora indolis]|uniref:transposase n=1 Tax=Lacrimispora indolis TaxID=69825 RepID=UPI0009FC9370
MARRNFDKVFKIVAVKLFHKDGMSVSEMPKELFIHYSSLYRWISEPEEYE